ncbi:MAG TPA: dUTP diphosphatase [Acetobacteraceae bacterium]|nr:dUTP diphosphatase [Acetobacteraceae bacterium]
MSVDFSPAIELRIRDKRLEQWGLPRYHSEMAAAIDLHACLDAPLVIAPGSPAQLVPSGIAIHIGHPHIAAVILPRSGLGHKKGLVLGNLQGLIDADYQGELMISVWNRNAPGTPPITVQPGERIAQMMFLPVVRPSFTVVDDFSVETAREAKGFGSTGVGH